MESNEFTVQTRTVSVTADKVVVPLSQGVFPPMDHMVRILTDQTTQSLVARSWETSDFMHGVYVWAAARQQEVDLLTSFATWQKHKLDFAGVYTAFLLDAISEDEFVEESRKYAITVQAKCEVDMVETAEKLVSILPFELTTADIAEYLRTEPRALLQVIAQTNNPSQKLKELLPSQTPELDDE